MSSGTKPFWSSIEIVEQLPMLEHDCAADVCVVGGGIAGMSVAYALCREGKTVIILDAAAPGAGETSHTTAHLSNALDDRYWKLEWFHGFEGSRRAAESHAAAIDRIERTVEAEKIDCNFERVDGYLFVAADRSADELRKELEAAHRAGLTDVEMLERTPLIAKDAGACLRFPRQAQFHPMKYLRGLATAIRRMGGKLYGSTRVSEIRGGSNAGVTTATGIHVSASSVVVATNTPINDRIVLHTKQAAYQTYAVGLVYPRRDATGRCLLWDTLDPYHYVRVAPLDSSSEQDLLIVGGEDHKTGQAPPDHQPFEALENWARKRFARAGAVTFRWSGEVMEPQDGLAFIGRNPLDDPNVYIVTGDSGHGMTHGTIAGMLITDLIQGRDNPWQTLYEPARKSMRAAWTFLQENLNTAVQYTDWLTPGELADPRELEAGCGAVIRRGATKIALYRDGKGVCHELSAVCPHLKGIVAWNAVEKTWDCPCHGSRFDATSGEVIHGPSLSGLSRIEQRREC